MVYVVFMGDFNCDLYRNAQGCTGAINRSFMNNRPDKRRRYLFDAIPEPRYKKRVHP